MISNVNLNASAHIQNTNVQSDEKLRNESNNTAAYVKNEINDEADAVVDVFSVSFWQRGVPKPFDPTTVTSQEAVEAVSESQDKVPVSSDEKPPVEITAVPGNQEYKSNTSNETSKSVDITVDGETFLDTSKN